jgi:hypothetical protein
MRSVPPLGGSISVTSRASVDLPQPDSPTMPSVLPVSSVNETPSTASSVADPTKTPRLTA